jgi:hypothetical protein
VESPNPSRSELCRLLHLRLKRQYAARRRPMITRSVLPLLAFAVPGAVGQIGLYGPVTTRLKASDLALDIRFAKVLDLMPFNAALIF